MRNLLIVLLYFLGAGILGAQNRSAPVFAELEVRVDTTVYSSLEQRVQYQGQAVLAFPVPRNDAAVEFFLYPPQGTPYPALHFAPSGDFVITDSLIWVDSAYYRVKIQFTDLARTGAPALLFKVTEADGRIVTQRYPLLPYRPTTAVLQTLADELFIGEEKALEINGENLANIKADNVWKEAKGLYYKLNFNGQTLRLYMAASEPGTHEVVVPLPLYRPIVMSDRVKSELAPLVFRFTARSSRTAYLALDKKEVNLDFETPRGTELQVEAHRLLQLRKTYRIETTAEPGGAFIGELYTRSALSNDKVLAWIRPFALHKASEGYLYLKDGDDLKFITNLAITNKTKVNKVLVMREGGDFTDNLAVSPGDNLEVRLEGTGLDRANFLFEGVTDAARDSATATDNVNVYHLRVPLNISRRKITIYRGKEPTGFELAVREFQTPHELDFVTLDWGAGPQAVNKLNKPNLYDRIVRQVTIGYNPARIDVGNKLYGKQYLSVEINIFNARKDLIEVRRLDNLTICPGENSIRGTYYDRSDCSTQEVNLNNLLGHKTNDLQDWSTIELTFRHRADKYGGNAGYSQRVELILQKHVSFDIDVSFPAGLLVKRVGTSNFDNLYGISMAVLAQFSFYHPEKINKPRPYRIGAGFIALNAFNFNQEASSSRDLGVVVIGSLFPTGTGSRFSFPLYLGGGYLLNADKFFFVLGPGIQVRL